MCAHPPPRPPPPPPPPNPATAGSSSNGANRTSSSSSNKGNSRGGSGPTCIVVATRDSVCEVRAAPPAHAVVGWQLPAALGLVKAKGSVQHLPGGGVHGGASASPGVRAARHAAALPLQFGAASGADTILIPSTRQPARCKQAHRRVRAAAKAAGRRLAAHRRRRARAAASAGVAPACSVHAAMRGGVEGGQHSLRDAAAAAPAPPPSSRSHGRICRCLRQGGGEAKRAAWYVCPTILLMTMLTRCWGGRGLVGGAASGPREVGWHSQPGRRRPPASPALQLIEEPQGFKAHGTCGELCPRGSRITCIAAKHSTNSATACTASRARMYMQILAGCSNSGGTGARGAQRVSRPAGSCHARESHARMWQGCSA